MAVERQVVTVAEYEVFLARPENADRLFELIDGEIVEKMVTWEHGIVAGNVVTRFNMFLYDHPIGRAGVEVRHRPINDDLNDRLPDVGVVLDISKPMVREGAVLFMPDLAVEIQSPRDSMKAMLRKAEFYLANGAKIVWLVYIGKRLVEVLTNDDRLLLNENDVLDGGEVLPGFTLAVKDIFRSL